VPRDWPPSWIVAAAEEEDWPAGFVERLGGRLDKLGIDLAMEDGIVRIFGEHHHEITRGRTVRAAIDTLLFHEAGRQTKQPARQEKKAAAQRALEALQREPFPPHPSDR
jgi:hypothetical protein